MPALSHAERRLQVGAGLPTRRAAGSAPAACRSATTRPLSTPAIAAPPSWPGMNAWTRPAARSAMSPSAYGRPETTTTTTGVPVSSSCVEQVGLDAGQPQVLGVAALARGAVAEQAGQVADVRDAEVRRRGRRDRRGEYRTGRRPVTSQPCAWTSSTPGSSLRSASSGAGHLDAQTHGRGSAAARGWGRRSSP